MLYFIAFAAPRFFWLDVVSAGIFRMLS